MNQFLATAIVDGVEVSRMFETRQAIAAGLLRPDRTAPLLAVPRRVPAACPTCGGDVVCQPRAHRFNAKFLHDGVVFRAPQFYEHVSIHECPDAACPFGDAQVSFSLDETSGCTLCTPELLADERPLNLLRGETKRDGTPRELSVVVDPAGDHHVHMHMSDLIPERELPPLPTDYQRLVARFARRDFLGCAELGSTLFPRRSSVEVLQLTLISMQRLGWVEQADLLGNAALLVEPDPLKRALFGLTVGTADISEALAVARGPKDECRARFYAAARLATFGAMDRARPLFRACHDASVDCMERYLAGIEEQWDPAQYNPATSERLYAESTVEEALQTAVAEHERGERVAALDRARDAVEVAKMRLGMEHAATAKAVGLFGGLLSEAGRHDEALGACREAVALARAVFGEGDARYAQANNNLAATYQRLDRLPEAKAAYESALQALRQSTGARTREYAISLDNLGNLMVAMGQREEGARLIGEALDILEAVAGKHDPDYMQTLGNVIAAAVARLPPK